MSKFAERREHLIFEDWLDRYGRAWESKDSAAFSTLFSKDCEYHWSPFGPVLEGPEAVARAFDDAVRNQHEIRFRYTVIDWSDQKGTCHWQCRFARGDGSDVKIDGVLRAALNDDERCEEFREWWHSNEA